MTDATKDWTGGEAPRAAKDPTTPAAGGDRLTPDTGAHTPPAGLAPAEAKTFAKAGSADGSAATPAELAADADALLRKSLETIRTQAEELKRQTSDWAAVRTDQARELIDERPLTVVAGAFGLGLIFGALILRR
jgi:ElaB/YqjD/DUF883 family membrane-anchored ribosome-binding protein